MTEVGGWCQRSAQYSRHSAIRIDREDVPPVDIVGASDQDKANHEQDDRPQNLAAAGNAFNSACVVCIDNHEDHQKHDRFFWCPVKQHDLDQIGELAENYRGNRIPLYQINYDYSFADPFPKNQMTVFKKRLPRV
ncbi:hypothetical protein D3C87_1504050 [compost metagenome]